MSSFPKKRLIKLKFGIIFENYNIFLMLALTKYFKAVSYGKRSIMVLLFAIRVSDPVVIQERCAR